VLIQRCPFFDVIYLATDRLSSCYFPSLGGEALGRVERRRLLAAEAAKSADSKRKAQQGKILQKRGAAAPARAGCPPDAFCVQRNENRIARSRVPRAERSQASQLSKQTELCLRKRASSEI